MPTPKPLVIKVIGTLKPACCARCIKPMDNERYTVGRFTYGACCILKVEEDLARNN